MPEAGQVPTGELGASGPGELHVLLVEDDAGDVLLTQEAFADHPGAVSLQVVNDGDEALRYLRREGEHAGAIAPDLVLLDLNLPRMSGREVLAAVKADPELRSIPVVVLTTSEAEADVLASYSLHASAYVTKPVDAEGFLHAVQQIDDFYGSVARLPQRPR